ncbi:hypothetical protein KIL84_022937 [Mauremys mutica]|uniref:Nuclear cap-binding protein subunit 2 n=1 Tax=Mauremys mutica TaxID=74926 RepID=A0A9D3WRQ7_9SAUR|nr:hypothetical protein KIL84_022937 [Mauremys mutica]
MCSVAMLSVLRSDSYVELSQYRDQHFRGNRYDQERLLKKSCTLYVGNLSFYTTEEQIYELFDKTVKEIVSSASGCKKPTTTTKRELRIRDAAICASVGSSEQPRSSP